MPNDENAAAFSSSSEENKLTARKWAAIGNCSVSTAQRDINELVGRHVLCRNPGGSKNTCYSLVR